ncbi:MAG: S41 family peptidase [Phycisphaerae bacterium]|nr:S41 family peptidase [Phycisphaerae bacterium]
MATSRFNRWTAGCLTAQLAVALGCASPHVPGADAQMPNGRRVLIEAITAMRNEALGRERIGWDELASRLQEKIDAGAPAKDAWPLIEEAVSALNDPHARFLPATPPTPSASTASRSTDAPRATPTIPEEPVGRMLNDEIAYVMVPLRGDADAAVLRAYAKKSRSVIAALAQDSPRGWIIDLRLNGGGTMWPMFLGMRPLLGDGVHLTSISGGRVVATFGVSGGEAWIDHGSGRQVQLSLPREEDAPLVVPGAKIAVLLGPWTMSSGEALAIAFSALPNVRSFGEHTGRLSTVTQRYTLSDGSVLILPVSVMADRFGRAFPDGIAPDERVAIGDWPTDDDEVAHAARRWITQPSDR